MVFFFDACLSKRIVKVLQYLGENVIALEDEFGRSDVDDRDWFPVAAEKNWIVLTSDMRIRKNPTERQVFEQFGLVTVFVYEAYAQQHLLPQASWMTGHWATIVGKTERAPAGTSFHANCNGKVLEWGEYEKKRKRQRK